MSDRQPSADSAPLTPRVWRVRNRGFISNTYIVLLEQPGNCIVIDPGLDLGRIEETLAHLKVRPVGIFCTHAHFDHIGSAAPLQDQFAASVHLHPADGGLLARANFLMMICKGGGRIDIPTVDVELAEGSDLLNGEDTIRVIHTPGHTPGSCMLQFRDVVFTGDTLYRDSAGLVNFPGENQAMLRDSLLRALEVLPGSSLVCPGHGGAGILDDIKRKNHELRTFLHLYDVPVRSKP
jgi:hydroxyacylglutathione hydrolase